MQVPPDTDVELAVKVEGHLFSSSDWSFSSRIWLADKATWASIIDVQFVKLDGDPWKRV